MTSISEGLKEHVNHEQFVQKLCDAFSQILKHSSSPTTDTVQLIQNVCKPLSMGKTCLFITSFPKSASHFLEKLLQRITGFEMASFIYKGCAGMNDELYLPEMIDSLMKNCIVKHHTSAVQTNLELIKTLNVRPMILTRNIFDCVPSLVDYSIKEIDYVRKNPAFDSFFELSRTEQHSYAIDYGIVFNILFYATWYHATKLNTEVDALWLDYKDVTKDTFNTLKRIFAFYNLQYSDEQILDTIHYFEAKKDSKTINYNIGVEGRGHQLTPEQQERIIHFASYWPEVDFSPIGIEAIPAVSKDSPSIKENSHAH